MSQPIHKETLFDFFSGHATSLQRKRIEEWLRESANEAFYYECLDDWEGLHVQYIPDTERALAQFINGLNEPQVTKTHQPTVQDTLSIRRRRIVSILFQIAAASVVLLGLGAALFPKQILYKAYTTQNAQTRPLRLADGSRVTLNANSTLYVPRWLVNERRVILEGEAEFMVTHTTDNRRFVVETGDDFQVEVLGTEFVVFARDRGKKVVLNRGKVKVHYQQGRELALKPGDMLTLDAKAVRPQLRQVHRPQLYNAWKNHQFYFDNTPLSEVANIIQDQFGIEVLLADSTLENRRLSGYFKASTHQEIAQIISTLLDLPIEQREKQLIILNPAL